VSAWDIDPLVAERDAGGEVQVLPAADLAAARAAIAKARGAP
jgi:hypothetical protein